MTKNILTYMYMYICVHIHVPLVPKAIDDLGGGAGEGAFSIILYSYCNKYTC